MSSRGTLSVPRLISFNLVLQFWDDPWRWGEPVPQNRRQHYVSHSGWKQRGLLLVHLQSTVPQPLPWVGLSAACRFPWRREVCQSVSCRCPPSETRVVCCVSPEQLRHPVWWMSRSRSVSTSTPNNFPGSCTTQTRSASGSSAPRPNCAALTSSRWDIHTFLGYFQCAVIKMLLLTTDHTML